MRKSDLLAVATALTLCAAPTFAATTSGTIDCANATTQTDMNICAEQDWQRADKKLNQLYTALQAKLDAKQKESLRDVQRSWLKFRDQQCAYEAIGYQGGSIAPMVKAACLAELTQQRN